MVMVTSMPQAVTLDASVSQDTKGMQLSQVLDAVLVEQTLSNLQGVTLNAHSVHQDQ